MKKIISASVLAAAVFGGSGAVAGPSAPTYVGAGVPALFGQYVEGQAPLAQFVLEQHRYLGFVYAQIFRPFYRETTMAMAELPVQVACCVLSPYQHADRVRVIQVFLDPNPEEAPVRSGLVGPIEVLVPVKTAEGVDELVCVTAPYIGRRVRRFP